MKMTAGRKCKVASILLSTVANPKTGFVTCIPTGTLPTLGPNACTWQQVFFSPLCKLSTVVKFIYSEKATKFCEIFLLLLPTVHAVVIT